MKKKSDSREGCEDIWYEEYLAFKDMGLSFEQIAKSLGTNTEALEVRLRRRRKGR